MRDHVWENAPKAQQCHSLGQEEASIKEGEDRAKDQGDQAGASGFTERAIGNHSRV